MKKQTQTLAKLLALVLVVILLAGVLTVTAAAAQIEPVKPQGSLIPSGTGDPMAASASDQLMAEATDSQALGVFLLGLTNGDEAYYVTAFYFTDGTHSYVVSDSIAGRMVEEAGFKSKLDGLEGGASAAYLGSDAVFSYFDVDVPENYYPLKAGNAPADEVICFHLGQDDEGEVGLYGINLDLSECKTEDKVIFDTGIAFRGNIDYGMPVVSAEDKSLVGEAYIDEDNIYICRFAGTNYTFATEFALESGGSGGSGEEEGTEPSEGSGETEKPDKDEKPDDSKKEKSEDNTKLYLIFGAAVVAGFLFYRKIEKDKNKDKSQKSKEGSISLEPDNLGGGAMGGTTPKASPTDAWGKEGQDIYGPTVPNPKKDSKPIEVPDTTGPTEPVWEKGTVPLAQWQLRGVEGPLSGKVYPLSGQLTIGRSANCDVRFSQDAPGISGTHCRVSVKDGKVYLKDLGSSYGTFYPGSSRLSPNTDYPLHVGETFSLAQGGGAFRLETAGAAATDAGGIAIKDMNGKIYRSDATGKLTLGRAHDCQGGFGSGETSVSGRHCVLYREGGKLYLMDLGSTNGTFFSQQERLRPNVPYRIRKGMAFFLTTPQYTFVVAEE